MRCRDASSGRRCESDLSLTPVGSQWLPLSLLMIILLGSCSSPKRISTLKENNVVIQLVLPDENLSSDSPESMEYDTLQRDTLKVKNLDGNDVFIMRAIRDEDTGEMVASEELNAAVISARFRNVAERMGKIDLSFILEVPEEMQASEWQLRLYPEMIIQEDTISLDMVILTGANYRRIQQRGYDRYSRYTSRIISNESEFIDEHMLGIFLERNLGPSHDARTRYGVDIEEAAGHYTDRLSLILNRMRRERSPELFNKYVKSPYITEAVRKIGRAHV